MATIKTWTSGKQYYVGDLVIDNNILYKLTAQAFVPGTRYARNTFVKIKIPSVGGTINGVTLDGDKEVVLKVIAPTGSNGRDANALLYATGATLTTYLQHLAWLQMVLQDLVSIHKFGSKWARLHSKIRTL